MICLILFSKFYMYYLLLPVQELLVIIEAFVLELTNLKLLPYFALYLDSDSKKE